MAARLPMVLLLLGLLQACGLYDDRTYQRAELASQRSDYAEAYYLWRPMAEGGHAASQYRIGWMYANGQGLALDESEALRWWLLAAEQGHADALFAVAKAYLHGEGSEQDPDRAVKWLWKAAGQGVEDAGIILRDMAGRDQKAGRKLVGFLLTGNRWRELGGVRRAGKRAAEVRAGRDKRHKKLATVEPETEVLALREEAGWVHIGIPGTGVMGWVQGKRLEGSG